MAKDYYEILGVSKNASPEEIKQAFRKLAHEHHPDKKGGDEKKFKEINEAYQVLSNPEKRQQYDQYGQTFEQAQSQGGFGGFNGFRDFSGFADAFRNGGNGNSQFDFGDLGDIFGDIFGSRTATRTRRHARGSDLELEIQVSFRESVFGAEKEVSLTKNSTCEKCRGSGAEPNTKVIQCKTCHGKGTVVKSMGFGIGFSTTCHECQGVGERYEKNCSQCRGTGMTREKKTLLVKIPAGIQDGQSIQLRGQGEAGPRGGRAGDLYIHVRVEDDSIFTREENNILSEVEITFPQAALGTKIMVETIDGKGELKVPEGTQSETVFRLRGKGVPHLEGRGRGDHLVKVIVKTPARLSRRQKKLLEEFDGE